MRATISCQTTARVDLISLEERPVGEGIEWDADFQRVLLSGHPHDFPHQSLEQSFLSGTYWRPTTVFKHRKSQYIDFAPNAGLLILLICLNVVLAKLDEHDSGEVPAYRDEGMEVRDIQ